MPSGWGLNDQGPLCNLWSVPGSHLRPPPSAPGPQDVNMMRARLLHPAESTTSYLHPWLALPCDVALSQARSTTSSCGLRAAFPRDCPTRLTSQGRVRSAGPLSFGASRSSVRMGGVPGLPAPDSEPTSSSQGRCWLSCLEKTPITLQSQSLKQDPSNFSVPTNYLGSC